VAPPNNGKQATVAAAARSLDKERPVSLAAAYAERSADGGAEMSEIQAMRARLDELRQLYLRATPAQRYKVARDRLTNPTSTVNRLILQVGAVEGFARSVALDLERRKGATAEAAYPSLRFLNAVRLLTDHIAPAQCTTPSDLFGPHDWDLFTLAVEYRNFLVHEASSLRAGHSGLLSDACQRVLSKLAEVAGVSP